MYPRRTSAADSSASSPGICRSSSGASRSSSQQPCRYLGRLEYLTHDADVNVASTFTGRLSMTGHLPMMFLARIGLELMLAAAAELPPTTTGLAEQPIAKGAGVQLH